MSQFNFFHKNKVPDNVTLIRNSRFFVPEWYLKQYTDVKAANIDPAVHYNQCGWKEGRDPGPNFCTKLYLENNPDVKEAGINPLVHFEKYGYKENRFAFADNHLLKQKEEMIEFLSQQTIDNSFPTEKGINLQEKRSPLIIVSLTSFPERIPYVGKTICSIMHQTYKPDKIILWLAESQFPNREIDLSQLLIDLCDFGLEIKWVSEDTKPYKKLIPALTEFPDDIIITADDDLYYPTYWIKQLIESYNENPNVIHCHSVTDTKIENDNIVFTARYGQIGTGEIAFHHKILSGSGTLFPPNSLHLDVLNQEDFMSLAPTNDDIWFWAMALRNNVPICWIKNSMPTLYYVDDSQENTPCLWHGNNFGKQLRAKQLKTVFEKYGLMNLLKH